MSTPNEIRAEYADVRETLLRLAMRTNSVALDALLMPLISAAYEIALQLAEMNERQGRVNPTHREMSHGTPAWECPECHAIVYSEGHYKQHLSEHEDEDRRKGGAL